MQIFEIKNMKMLKEFEGQFSSEIINALKKTDREMFVQDAVRHHAFNINALPMSGEQWISSPLTVAKMTSYLLARDVEGVCEADSVLEIGLGSGYQAVVLSHLIRRVFSIERIQALWEEARVRIAKLGITNINIKLDDGMSGWAAYAPYDRILLSACADSIPASLFNQLSDNGVLVAPIYCGESQGKSQKIIRFIKRGSNITEQILESCEFVPIKPGISRNTK
ncbi:protein-L-isoaspartate(D-aspartate) O-methyltransferase [Helicobacter saguini]|uniref:Protein-L-isoaspartate O-methyltransferase n=1 Tax=Helicobacter saguini TaxID=1548018 RepID=A0A347VS22_9HELI|nr:protein-L-isoaspartate(D-aspartate) O-methyltransferase [Helicobacter saguini]MWV62682.1 protein-L-isoaspartate(D-aspartate) O-methyltransferase [Helicobacter saguini]MWV66646.1 protein-L-isoaspartate(D-aspartate) O-methyltransferase [Helicobacter saguini]MWV68996.1 protein-L-isoaspartate(D-aspartate) O-methyltransferase [Helicobacter saguini]MWV71450.1 protein-L-isoaspartate(D-aspartate) O-methyltransferase [Helicobacter saguini]TLD94099.1 protein-L-isoaspartate(D-aspartate) O-methyltransf